MVCIYCKSATAVVNSRSSKRQIATWRRRQCQKCKAVFTTWEKPDLTASLRIQKGTGSVEPFIRDRLLLSIHSSVSHRKNALADAQGLTDTIINALLALPQQGLLQIAEVKSLTKNTLKRFDNAAYTYYTAHHT